MQTILFLQQNMEECILYDESISLQKELETS